MYNRFRYGNTFVKGSSMAQTEDAPIDANFDPMYNRFRYGDTFVKGSSLANKTPDHPEYAVGLTAGASDEAQPRFGSPYFRA